MKKFYLMCLGILLLGCMATAAYAQKTVTGTVKDSSGETLPAVSIQVKNTQKSTSTNTDGKFSISVTEGNILVFRYVGYKPQEVTVAASTSNLDIVMEPSTNDLSEVVVTALGVKREKRALGYSAQTVAGKDITIAQAPTIAQGLMGKVAGLQIAQAGGGVEGGSSRIVVRGNTTLTGDNRALIIVDGVALNNDPVNNNRNNGSSVGGALGSDVSSFNDWGTGMNFINPEDIEDITVLKGPSAAALYGARGGNGVILITRKKGQNKKGLGVDYSFSTRRTNPREILDFQNEYGSGLIGSMWTADQNKQFPVNGLGQRYQIGTYTGTYASGDYRTGAYGFVPYNNPKQAWDYFSFPSGLSWGPRFDNQPILWYDGVMRPYSAQPDNWKAYFPNGYTNQHNVAISGGGDFGTARFSYTRDDNKANILNSDYQSNTFNLGSTLKVSKKLSAEVTASYVNYQRLNTPPVGAGNYLAGMAYAATRDYDPAVEMANNFAKNGNYRVDVTDKSNFPANSPAYPYYSYMANSFWNIYRNNTSFNRNQLIGGIKINADLTDWFNVTAQGGVDNSNDNTEFRNYPTDVQGTVGSYKESMARSLNRNISVIGRLHKDGLFGKEINGSFSAGVESYYRNDYAISNQTNGNFLKPFVFALNNGANTPTAAEEIRFAKKINSAYGFLNLSYKNFLFLEATGRNDWSSTLSSNNNSYFYPSVNVSYIFSDGSKQKSLLPGLSFGKLKLSYAETGSDTDPYTIFNLLDVVNYNGQAAQSYSGTLQFPNVLPARSRQYEVGLNLGFLNNRINLDLSAYTMKSYNQILNTPLPLSSGYGTIKINNGSLGNRGIEFIINASVIKSKDFGWDVALNGASSRTKVLALANGLDELTLGTFFNDNGISQRVKVGEDYGTIYGKDYTYKNGQKVVKRALDASGNVMTYTVNGQNYVAGTQWVLSDKEVPIGNSQPLLTGGISNTFRYKDFSLYVLTDAKIGGDTYFGSYAAAMGNGLLKETLKERNGGGLPLVYPDGTTANTGVNFGGVFADGTPNNDVVNYQWYYLGTYSAWNNLGVPRSAAVFKNSWMKLREVALTYKVPEKFLQKTKFIQNLSVSLVGRDLFYIFTTIPKGLNPEGVNGIGNVQGIEYSSMPRVRSFGFTVRSSF